MKIKALALAAITAVLALMPAPARAVECDQLTTGLNLCVPRYGTDFDQWATSDINALTLINSSAAVTGSTSTAVSFGEIAVRKITGLQAGPAGIWISSATTQTSSATITGSGGLGVTYGFSAGSAAIAGGLTASSASFIGGGGLGVTYGITAGTATITGTASAARFSATYGISAATGVFTGTVTANDLSLVYGMSATTASFSGTVQAARYTATFGVEAASAALTYGLTAGTGTFSSGLTASSGTFLATGATQYGVKTSSGISMGTGQFLFGLGGYVQWADGSKSTTASSGGGDVVFVSTSITIAAGSTNAAALGVAFGTATVTFTGTYNVACWLNAPVQDDSNGFPSASGLLLNGAFFGGQSSTVGLKDARIPAANTVGDLSFFVLIPKALISGSTTLGVLFNSSVSGNTLSWAPSTPATKATLPFLFCTEVYY